MQSAAKIVKASDFSKEVKKTKDGAEFYSMSRPKWMSELVDISCKNNENVLWQKCRKVAKMLEFRWGR